MRSQVLVPLALLWALGGCDGEPSAAERAAQAEADVAMVGAAQDRKPPLEELYPEPITAADIDAGDLFGPSCAMQHPSGAYALALAMDDNGYLKLDGDMVRFAPDKGSADQPVGTWSKYDGREKSFSLRIDGEGIVAGEEVTDYPARLLVRDNFDRIVFDYSGTARCGS